MNLFLRIDVNILAFIMLVYVYYLANRHLEKHDALNKMYLQVSLLIIHILLLETTTCIINRRPELWLIPVAELLHVLLFVICPISTFYIYLLFRKIVFPGEEVFRRRNLILVLPVVISAILAILSPLFHFVFYIDDTNVYHRGDLYLILAFTTYFYIVLAMFVILVKRKQVPRQDVSLLVMFIGLPLIGSLVQMLCYGLLLIWSSTAFSLVLAYITLQQRMMHLDELTGAWDRRSFEYYISQRLIRKNESFGAIYVDINSLKQINDTFGHQEGDISIKTTVEILRNEIRREDILVRLGGDEFIIVLEDISRADLFKTIDRFETAFMLYNKSKKKDYWLECSFGADIYGGSFSSIEQFINHIDNLMYQNKNMKKRHSDNILNRTL